MKKSIGKTIVSAICALPVLFGTACADEPTLLGYTSFAYFNTQATWAFLSEEEEASQANVDLWGSICERLSQIEESLSTGNEESSISRFNAANAGDKVEIDFTAYTVLSEAKRIYEKTDGAYNPAVGLLVDLWGFTPRFTDPFSDAPDMPYDRDNYTTTLPAQEYIDNFRALSDFSSVLLEEEGGKYYATKPSSAVWERTDEEGNVVETYTMQVNLGGIGKGYAVDEAHAIMREAGQQYGYFNLGGSSISVLQNYFSEENEKGLRPQSVGMNNPRKDVFSAPTYASVLVADSCLSTSGDNELYYPFGEQRFCHIINPHTGYPVNGDPQNPTGSGIITASVSGLSASEGDATTTALMVMGKEGALAYIEEYLSDKGVTFIYYDGVEKTYTVYTNLSENILTLNVEGMARVQI